MCRGGSTEDEDGAGTDEDNPETEGTGTEEDDEGRRVREKLARLKQMGGRGGAGMRRARSRRGDSGASASSKSADVVPTEPKAKGPKKPTTWHDGTGRISRSDMDRLDRSMDKDKVRLQKHERGGAGSDIRGIPVPFMLTAMPC